MSLCVHLSLQQYQNPTNEFEKKYTEHNKGRLYIGYVHAKNENKE